jgi:hypothetical protein
MSQQSHLRHATDIESMGADPQDARRRLGQQEYEVEQLPLGQSY